MKARSAGARTRDRSRPQGWCLPSYKTRGDPPDRNSNCRRSPPDGIQRWDDPSDRQDLPGSVEGTRARCPPRVSIPLPPTPAHHPPFPLRGRGPVDHLHETRQPHSAHPGIGPAAATAQVHSLSASPRNSRPRRDRIATCARSVFLPWRRIPPGRSRTRGSGS